MCIRIFPGASQSIRGSVRLKTKEVYHRLYVETESSSFDRTCLKMNRQADRSSVTPGIRALFSVRLSDIWTCSGRDVLGGPVQFLQHFS